MTLLIAGLALFFITHLIPSLPGIRTGLKASLKPNGYKAVFSLLSLGGLALIVYGLMQAPFQHLYAPPSWGRHLAMLLMLPALYLFLSNATRPVPSSAQVWTAHPMNWGVVIWASAHLLANGDLAHVLLFSSFLLFSLISIISGNRRGASRARSDHPPLSQQAVFIVIVLAIYGGLLWGHRYFTGMPLLGSG